MIPSERSISFRRDTNQSWLSLSYPECPIKLRDYRAFRRFQGSQVTVICKPRDQARYKPCYFRLYALNPSYEILIRFWKYLKDYSAASGTTIGLLSEPALINIGNMP
jgi:hypothetical protein